jgi:hypothetical protein
MAVTNNKNQPPSSELHASSLQQPADLQPAGVLWVHPHAAPPHAAHANPIPPHANPMLTPCYGVGMGLAWGWHGVGMGLAWGRMGLAWG